MNGGFGLLLDGSDEAAKRARLVLNWDVSNGVRVLRGEQHDRSQPRSLCTTYSGSHLVLCAAGGSPLLVRKLKRLRDHPAHHGGERPVAGHHAFPCAGWVRAGPCPAGLARLSTAIYMQPHSKEALNDSPLSSIPASALVEVWGAVLLYRLFGINTHPFARLNILVIVCWKLNYQGL